MKISVILVFLLSWSFVSSNPHRQALNDKSVSELNHENDGGSDSSNLTRMESSDDASSGKDWGGDNSFGQMDLDSTDKTDDTDEPLGHEPFLLTLISERSKMGAKFVDEIAGGIKKMIGTSILNNESSDIPSNGENLSDDNHNENILPWTRENTKALGELFAGQNREGFVDEETGRHGNRAKRDSGTSTQLWSSPHIDSISEQLLKLSEGSTSNVLRSEKATVAEALNGRAIRKILERARAQAAKVVPHKDLYNTNDFSKWLLSGSPFDMNIFRHLHHRPSENAKVKERPDPDTDDALRHRTSSTLHSHVFDATNRRHQNRHHLRQREGKHIFSTLFEPTAADAASTEYSYDKLLHKSKHRERLSPELQITSGEGRGETAGMFRKPTAVSHQAHRSLSYKDDTADDTGLQYYSHAYAPHMRVTEDEDAGNGMPRWKHAKWIHRFGTRAPPSADSPDSGEEVDDHERRHILRSIFDGFGDEEDDEGARAGRRERHRVSSGMDIYGRINRDSQADKKTKLIDSYGKTNWEDILGRKWYYYGIGNGERSVYDGEADADASGDTENRHLADFLLERKSSVDSRRGRNISNKNKHPEHDGVERSAIYSTTSAEATSGAASERSSEVLTTKISAGTPKATDVDVEHYHWRDRNVAANSTTSLPSSLSGEKGSKRTNNALTSPSADDGSARREAAESGVPRRTQPAIDNDAAEMGFSGIKSQPWANLPWAHSSRVRSKTHLENQRAHRGGYERAAVDAIASTETEHSMDSGGDAPLGRAKTRKHSPAGEYGNYADHDLGENQVVDSDAESSAEAMVGSEYGYDLLGTTWLDDSREKDYAGIDWERLDLHDDRRRHRTSVINFPNRSDEAYILMPEFPIYKFRKGYWPYNVNYYDPNSEEMRDDQEIEVGESTRDWKEGELNYGGWEQEGEFSTGHEASKKSNISNARRSDGQYSQHSEYGQRNRYTFDQFLHDMMWSSSITNITEYETWEEYIAYLYYIWMQKYGNSDASFEAPTLATEENEKQDNAVDEEISLDRHGRKHTTNEDNYIHLRKHKKLSQRTGELMIRNVPGLKQDKIKSITVNNGKTSNEDYGEGELISEENVDNQRKNQETLTRTGNIIREDSMVDIMSKARKRIIDNNSYHQQGSWNSLENSHTDARIKTDSYDSHRRNKNVDINQTAETTESTDSKNDPRHISTETSSTSRSYAESQMDEHAVDTSSDLRKIVTRTQAGKRYKSGKEDEYRDKTDFSDISAMSSESIDESQIKRMHHMRKKSRTDQENSASMETLTKAILLNGATDKSQSNVQGTMIASELSAESQIGSKSSLENLVRKHSTNAETSANAISVKDRQESENTSSFSKSSVQSEMEDYSNESMRNVRINNSGALSASSSKSFAKSKAKTEQTENKRNSKNIQVNANAKASSTATLSDNTQNESTLSSRSSAESQLESDYYLTKHKDNRISAISRSLAGSTLSDTVVDERQSHSQRSSSSSSFTSLEELQAESQHDSNSIQNSQMNVATAKSLATSASLSNAKSGHWSDSSSTKSSSKSWEEAQKHNSNNVINIQESNIENQSELESASKSHVRSILKDKRYLSVIEGNENNIVNANAKTTSSAAAKNDERQESASCSFAESQMENRNSRKETSISNTISSNVVNDTEQRNLLRALLSSQTASKDVLRVQQEDPQIISKSVTFETSTETNDNKNRREDNALQATWFVDPKNNLATSTNIEVAEKAEAARENSNIASNAAASATVITSTDIRNAQNSKTMSSSVHSKAETKIHSKNQLKESDSINRNWAISRISAMSGKSNEVGDNDKNKLLEESSLSESHSALAEENRRVMDTTQNSQESMAAAKAESTVSSNDVRSRSESAEESTLFAFSEEARRKQKNRNVRRGKSDSIASEATLITTSNDVNNEHRGSALQDESSVVSYKEVQTDDKLGNKNGASDPVEVAEQSVRNNKRKMNVKHVSSHDYRDGEYMESVINSRGGMKYSKRMDNINEMMSTGSVTSTVSSNANRNNILKVTSSDNLHAESLREDEDKSNIHSGADEAAASTEITSYDDKQARGNILRKLIFLSNPSDEAQMMHGGNYEITKKLPTANGNKELHWDNSREMLPSDGLQINWNVESTADTSESTKDDPSTSTDMADVDFKGDSQDDPNVMFTNANIQDENQVESTSSTDTRAQSKVDQKSSVSWKNKIIDEARDMYDINMWRTKCQTTASSSSCAETQDKFADMLKTKASTESMSSQIDDISHESGSTREQSSSISSGFHNYGDYQRADMADVTEARTSAETSISSVSSIECQDEQKETSAISQLKRHDFNARNRDKGITSNVLQSAEETEFNGMQNAQQRKLSGSITSSGTRTGVRHEEIAKEGLEVTASAATSAQTMSSEAVESESREKLIGASSESDKKSRNARKHSFNAVSRQEQIIANAEADSAASNNLEGVRQSNWMKKDSLADSSRDMQCAKIENILESNLANIADFATSSTKETGYGAIEDERQSGVTTTASLSNSRAEAQQQRDCNSSVRQESTETSSSDTQNRVLKTESIVNSMEENLNAVANAVTLADAISSSGVQDSWKTLSSANSYAESRTDNTRTQTMASNKLRNVEIDKSLQTTSSSDANARATGENTNDIWKDSSAVANARTEVAACTNTKDTDPSHGPFDLLNAAGNSQETANVEVSATSSVSASVDARGKHTDNFVREESDDDTQIQEMTETGNDDSTLQIDQRNNGNAEASAQAASFSDVKDELQERDESRVLQKQRFIAADSTASSVLKTFDRADSIQENNLEESIATSSSDAYERSNVENESRVLAKERTMDVLGASTSTQTIASSEVGCAEGDELLQTTLSSDTYANAQATDTNGAGEDLSAVANARTETATSNGTKRTDQHNLFDLLTGAVTGARTEESISRRGTIKEDLSRTSSNVLAGVEGGSTGSGNSATVDTIAETGSGDRRNQQGDWRGTASWFGGIRDGQLDVMKSTSSANSYAAAQTTSEGSIVEEDPGVNTLMLEAAEAHNQVKGEVDPSGWLVTTSDAAAVAEGRAQNKDELDVLREVGEVPIYAAASTGTADAGSIGCEQRDSRTEEAAECRDGTNAATKIRHTAVSGASAATMTSMEMENKSRSVSSNQMTSSSSSEAIAEPRIRTGGRSSVSRNFKFPVDIKRTRSSTTASAASRVSTSIFDNLGMNHRARYRQSWSGMPARNAPTSKEIRRSSGETTILYPSREISKCDENVETREFISEATSLYQMLDKQQGSEILLMKKNPKGPVQIANFKNSVSPLITYRLIPREVYERIRAIIARKQIFCTNCALSRALKTRAIA